MTKVSLIIDGGGEGLVYEDVTDWSSNGSEIEMTLASGDRIVSNCKYIVQEPLTPEN